MQNDERRPEILIVETLGPVYADKIIRVQSSDDTIYYSKGGVWVGLTAAPSAHAASHENGGSDEIDVTGLSGVLADAQDPTAHAADHENGGLDEITVTGLAGLLADVQKVGVRKNSAGSVFQRQQLNLIEGNLVTLTVADDGSEVDITIAVNTHATTHQSGGSDPIKLDDLASPDDNTDLNASTSAHGLLKKLSNVVTEFLDGTGNWSTPAGGNGVLTQKAVRVFRSTAQTVANSTSTAISFDTEIYDTAAMWAVGNPTRLVAPLTGVYHMTAAIQWVANATGTRYCFWRKNGTTDFGQGVADPGDSSADQHNRFNWSAEVMLSAGDYVECIVNQGSGGNLDLSSIADFFPVVSMHLVGSGSNVGAARATKSGAQTLTTGATTALTFDTETFDSNGYHDTGSNTSRMTADIAGKYMVEGCVRFAANSTGKRLALIQKQGTTIYAVQEQNAVPSPDETHVSVCALVDLTAGQYVELYASQNSGGNLDVSASFTHISMFNTGGA